MKRYFKLGRPLALLYAPAFKTTVDAVKVLCTEGDGKINPNIPFLEIEISCIEYEPALRTYTLEPPVQSCLSQTGSLFFTSGTSGVPKGVVHTYQALLASARERIQTWNLTENDVVLNQKPGNWMGGIFGIIPSLISGACL